MIVVKDAQLRSLEAGFRDEFLDQLPDILRGAMPEEAAGLTPDALRALVGRAAEKARGYGITLPEPLAQFASLCLALGESFDRDPDIAAYLSAGEMDQETKMSALLDAIEAAQAVDP